MGSESCACKDFIRNFVKQLSENDDTPVVVQSAFAQIAWILGNVTRIPRH